MPSGQPHASSHRDRTRGLVLPSGFSRLRPTRCADPDAAACSFVFGLNRGLASSVHHLEGTKLLYPAAAHLCILDTATDQAS